MAHAKVRDGKIICDYCDSPAVCIHVFQVDEETNRWMVLATCSEHGISGLNFFIHEIAEEPFWWLIWMSNKSDNAVLEILRWLGGQGARALAEAVQNQRRRS
ncbi:hypothetical protein SAMN02746089_02657 [Caldanaerobius fijiensis DSM 17918]|uniref:Uncharacterized protein n=1 Tax=Caldanaerobius fijiensis DSM 17918 TaxID=1121256 RepID=A0A1M5F023_9THEO|nr:hypothetical protein [Caldanaerobius fijiensis]SHF84883.1 hypothetical protein SAMN02746089_02657 [Caldanaerobius fijiensis DSM 17918]